MSTTSQGGRPLSALAPAAPPLPQEAGLGALVPTRPPRSLWSNAWRQFRRNKMAMVGLGLLVCLAFMAIFAPAIAPQNPVRSDLRVAGKFRQAAWVEDEN